MALVVLAQARKSNNSASGNFYAAAAVAAELGEGERDAFEHLESAIKEKPRDPELHYGASSAYSLASKAVTRKDKTQGRVEAVHSFGLDPAIHLRNRYRLISCGDQAIVCPQRRNGSMLAAPAR